MKRVRVRLSVVLLACAATGAAACDDDDESFDGGVVDAAIAINDAGQLTLSDPEILAVTDAINNGEVALGQLAQNRASNEGVQTFAATMIQEHTAAINRQIELEGRTDLIAVDTRISQEVNVRSQGALADLSPLTGIDFDRAYMATEVAQHRAALDLIDGTLLPSVANEELRLYLDQLRAAEQVHLQQAQETLMQFG